MGRTAVYRNVAGVLSALLACAAISGARAAEPSAAEAPAPGSASQGLERAYRLSWSVRAIGADALHTLGYTGKGVVVAVIDSGVDQQPGLARHLSNASVDILPGRKIAGGDRHGVYVADALAGSPDGGGAVGVAYDATVLSIRADSDRACADSCGFSARNLARAIDYAVSRKARIIDLSLSGPDPLGKTFEAALARAVASGAVIVIAAGNDGAAEPAWPGRYAADPRFAGAVAAVGAVDRDGAMAAFSNRAGGTAGAYIAAPGQKVVVDCDHKTCALVSGTSFAAPHVAGALALLLQAFPDMTGREALSLLMRSAERGAPADAAFGQGRLDVAGAYRMALAERTARF